MIDGFKLIRGNYIHQTAIIGRDVKIGTGNVIGPYTVIGSNGEIRGKDFQSFKGNVIIGDNNTISEMVTIQKPFNEGQSTYIGNNNLIMAHSHIGHDAYIGSDCEICSGVIVGGYATIQDKVKIKLGVTIRNRIVIGKESLVGLGSAVVKNIESKKIVYGNPAKEKK